VVGGRAAHLVLRKGAKVVVGRVVEVVGVMVEVGRMAMARAVEAMEAESTAVEERVKGTKAVVAKVVEVRAAGLEEDLARAEAVRVEATGEEVTGVVVRVQKPFQSSCAPVPLLTPDKMDEQHVQ